MIQSSLKSFFAGLIAGLTISLVFNVLIVTISLLMLMKISCMSAKRRKSGSLAPNEALYSEGIVL